MKQKKLLQLEVMDRSSIVLDNMHRALSGHKGLTKKTAKKLEKASDALYDVYNTAASEFYKGK